MDEQPKTLAEIEQLIRTDSSEDLTEQELVRYLQFAEMQERLDYENSMAFLSLA